MMRTHSASRFAAYVGCVDAEMLRVQGVAFASKSQSDRSFVGMEKHVGSMGAPCHAAQDTRGHFHGVQALMGQSCFHGTRRMFHYIIS